jgi:hypothetical protein
VMENVLEMDRVREHSIFDRKDGQTGVLPPSAPLENTPGITSPNIPRPSAAVSPKPTSTPYYIPPDSDDDDDDDESSSDESLDHGGDIGPPAHPAVDAVAPVAAPAPPQTPPHPASPVAPPRAPSPVGIGARLPRQA